MGMSVPGYSCSSCRSTSTNSGCVLRLAGECVYYSGGNISGPAINTGDNLNVLINKIIDYIDTVDNNREEIDVFLIGGQSNARGVGNRSQSPQPTSDTVYQYFSGAFTNVTTGDVGFTPSESSRGSAWTSFGITWYNNTGRKIAFVPTAVDGSGQLPQTDTGFGNWSPSGGTLFQNSVTQLNSAIVAIIAADMKPVFKGILWCQGENDGNGINNNVITSSDYSNGLTTMIAAYRTSFGQQTPFYIFRTGTRVGFPDTGFSQIRAAQQSVAAADILITSIVFYNAVDYPTRGLMADQYHYVQAGYNEMGKIGAEKIISNSQLYWQRQGTTSLYYNGNVGIGLDIPVHPLHVNGGTSTTRSARFTQDSNITGNVYIENINAGINAAAGIRFFNNTAINGQLVLGSSAYSTGAHKMTLNSFTGDLIVGSNSGQFEIFTGASGPTTANVRVRVNNAGQVAIGSDPTPGANAALDVQSTSKFFFPPRMTSTQASAVTMGTGDAGAIGFISDTNGTFTSVGWWGWDGSAWQKLNN